jgi:hypothetical protein
VEQRKFPIGEKSRLRSMYGPPPNCKRFEVDEGTVRVNVSGL